MRRRTLLRAGAGGLAAVAGCGGPAVGDAAETGAGTADHAGTGATVTGVVDGDTVDARLDGGATERLRLLGVDTPEPRGEVSPGEFEGVPDTGAGRACLRAVAEAATAFARERLTGRRVRLRFDPNEGRRGSYGRLLVYVAVDGEPFNRRLVERGLARVYDSRFVRRERFYAAESRAMAEGRGVWACRSPDG